MQIKFCEKCNNEIEKFCEFPNGLCQNCYYAIMEKIPLEQLEKPDFVKSIN